MPRIELILLQPNPAIQKAWQDVANAITENEVLSVADRFPEPYFARVAIWAAAGNYPDSLQDYLTGIRYVRRANRDLLPYSAYFDKLLHAAGKLQELPAPEKGAQPDLSVLARQHYSHGYSLFLAASSRKPWTDLITQFSWPSHRLLLTKVAGNR